MSSNPFKKQNKQKEDFSYWLQHRFAIDYEQHIQALVYVGAAFLVIIVGLRGLGDISDISFVPRFLLNDEGKVHSNIVMVGLFIEFTMLLLLAAVSYFAPPEKKEDLQSSIDTLASSINRLTESSLTEAAQKVMQTAENTAEAAEKLLLSEVSILSDFRKRLDEKLVQLDNEIIHVRHRITQGIIDSNKEIESFIEQEKESVSRYKELVENLIVEASAAMNKVSQTVSAEINKTFDTASKSMIHQRELVDRFFESNSKLLAETRDSYHVFIKNFSEMVERENERLKWLTANQVRPEEVLQKINRTNDRLITHLENIDNTLKSIKNRLNGKAESSQKINSFYQRFKNKWKEL